jgi:type III secretory pathway component EscV
LNPANGNHCWLIDAREESTPPEHLRRTPLGYLVWVLEAELREAAGCLVDSRTVRAQLDQLSSGFGDLVAAWRSFYSDRQLACVLRQLAAERISIRDLRLILGAALDFDMIKADSRFIVFDDRLPSVNAPERGATPNAWDLTAFVRMQMKRYVSHTALRGQTTLQIYLLALETKQIILNEILRYQAQQPAIPDDFAGWFGENRREKLLQAIREQTRSLAPFIVPCPILTTVEVCAWVRELIAEEFPHMAVLAYQELSPEVNLLEVARIDADFTRPD